MCEYPQQNPWPKRQRLCKWDFQAVSAGSWRYKHNICEIEHFPSLPPPFWLLKRDARVYSECETFWTYNWRKGMHLQRRGWHSRNSFHGPSVCGGLKFGPFSQVPQPNRPKVRKWRNWPDLMTIQSLGRHGGLSWPFGAPLNPSEPAHQPLVDALY